MKKSGGFALLEPLVAAAVLGGLVIVSSVALTAYSRFQAHTTIEGNLEGLRQQVRDTISCDKTVEDPFVQFDCSAPSGNFIAAKALDGSQIIAKFNPLAASTSRYLLRLVCRIHPSDLQMYEIIPEVAVGYSLGSDIPPTPSFARDPFTRREYAWRPLLKVPIVCAKAPTPPVVELQGTIPLGIPSGGPLSIFSGQAVTLSWTSSFATSCILNPGGFTELSNVGVSSGPLLVNTDFSLTCVGPGGTATDTLQVNVGVACTPGIVSRVLRFEEFSEGADVDLSMNTQLMRDYGVSFTPIAGGSLRVAGIASEGDSTPTFNAWMSILCPRQPKYNRICNRGSGTVGQRALSTTDATRTRNISFEVTYVSPVRNLSFDILDLDGGERWIFSAYDEFNSPIGASTVIANGGYGAASGNNGTTRFTMAAPTNLIKKIRLSGTKSITIFGFGFDNFTTGLVPCP